MADNDEFDQDEHDDETPKDLRKQIAKAKRENADLLARLSDLEKQSRKRTISDVLIEKGLPAKVANLLPDTVEADPASIDAWLTEYADIFGAPKGDDGGEQDVVDEQTKAAHERVASATAGGAPTGTAADLTAKIMAASSPAELSEILANARN